MSEEMASMVPAGFQGNADVLFGNLHELYTFHSETFLKDLENCISTTELVALCFVQRVSFLPILMDFCGKKFEASGVKLVETFLLLKFHYKSLHLHIKIVFETENF